MSFQDVWNFVSSQGVTNVLTFLVLIATGISSRAAVCALREVRRQYNESSMPRIQVSLLLNNEFILCLMVRNLGLRPAENFSIKMLSDTRTFFGGLSANLQDVWLFNKPVDYFGPQDQYAFPLFLMSQLGDNPAIKDHVLAPIDLELNFKYGPIPITERRTLDPEKTIFAANANLELSSEQRSMLKSILVANRNLPTGI